MEHLIVENIFFRQIRSYIVLQSSCKHYGKKSIFMDVQCNYKMGNQKLKHDKNQEILNWIN